MSSNTPPRPQDSAPDAFLRRRFFARRTLLTFLIAFLFLFLLLFRVLGVDVSTLVQNVRSSNPLWYFLAFLIFYLGFPLRAWRWLILLGNVGYSRSSDLPSRRRMTEAILLGWFANCIVPAKLGDAYRAYLLRQSSQVGFATGLGTIVAERALDFIVLVFLLGVAAAIGLGGWSSRISLAVVVIGLVLALGIVAILVFVHHFRQGIGRRLPHRLQPYYEDGLRGVLGSLRRLPQLTTLSILIWFTEIGRLFLVSQSLGFSLSYPLIIFAALANSLLTAVPFTPGGLGLVEGGLIGILVIALSRNEAVSLAFLDRSISYYSLIVVGLLIMAARGAMRGKESRLSSRHSEDKATDIEQV